ncbi:MAG: hypothetical protein GXY50_07815, partial [Syntrophomonadaceae bacterium]|nr:hypothetical protein [Syntrophomonadaceae bacterium]
MMKKWFDILINKAKQSWSQLIVVNDPDQLGSDPLLLDLLKQDFAVVSFQGELSLRQFIRQHQSRQILILLQKEAACLPYDIEQNADLISWTLTDIFPRLDSKALRMFEMDGYQSIYEAYQESVATLGILDEQQTLFLIREWIAIGKVLAHEKGYGGIANVIKIRKHGEVLEKDSSAYDYTRLVKDIRQLLEQDKKDWPLIARRWGELESLYPAEMLETESYFALDHEISQLFQDYIIQEYDQLFFASYINGPV